MVLEDIGKLQELQKKIARVRNYRPQVESFEELAHKVQIGEVSPGELAARMNAYANAAPVESFVHNGHSLDIRHLAKHYYLPLLLSKDEKIDFINRVIHVPSEVDFIDDLAADLEKPDNLFKQYDWWMFSRADEHLDSVVIPYYDPVQNQIRDFHPDFVFWLVKGDKYTILFVDPKGMRERLPPQGARLQGTLPNCPG